MMLNLIRKVCFATLLLAVPFVLQAKAITKVQQQKLEPRIQAVLAKEQPTFGITTVAPQLPQALARRTDGSFVYQVIIYTNDPQELHDNNIPINSTLPSFVTARLTSSEIIEALQLDNVNYLP